MQMNSKLQLGNDECSPPIITSSSPSRVILCHQSPNVDTALMSLEDSPVLSTQHEPGNVREDTENYVLQELAPVQQTSVRTTQDYVIDSQRRETETEQWSFAEHPTESTSSQHYLPEENDVNPEDIQFTSSNTGHKSSIRPVFSSPTRTSI